MVHPNIKPEINAHIAFFFAAKFKGKTSFQDMVYAAVSREYLEKNIRTQTDFNAHIRDTRVRGSV